MADKGDIIFWSSIMGVFLIFGVFIYNDFIQTKTIEGRILAISTDEWPWRSTTIVFATYSEYTITKLFEGHLLCDHQPLEIGSIYKITHKGYLWHAYRTVLDIEKMGEWIES